MDVAWALHKSNLKNATLERCARDGGFHARRDNLFLTPALIPASLYSLREPGELCGWLWVHSTEKLGTPAFKVCFLLGLVCFRFSYSYRTQAAETQPIIHRR